MSHLPKDLPASSVVDAMKRFDKDFRQSPPWVDWHNKKSQCFAIEHDGKLYPPKLIISLASGCPVNSFSGGAETNSYLARRGFCLIVLRKKVQNRRTSETSDNQQQE